MKITPKMLKEACKMIQNEEISESAGFKKWMLVQMREILPRMGKTSQTREHLREENCADENKEISLND